MPNDDTPKALNIDDFPVELRRRLKVTAAASDMTMKAAAIEAIEHWVRDHSAGVPA